MENNNVISFIIPTYNAADTIVKCLASIKALEYPYNKSEIIIVDNGSSDSTRNVGAGFTNKIYVNTTETIAGLRNLGAKNAKGNFLAFIDSDCIIPQNWGNKALEHFKNKQVGMVGTRTILLPENVTWVERAWKKHLDREKYKKEVLWLFSCAIMVRKDVFEEVGGFDESLITCEDVDFGYKIRKKYTIIADEQLAPVHLRGEKTLTKFFKKESWRGKNSIKVELKQIMQKKKTSLMLAMLFYYLTMFIIFIPAAVIASITQNIGCVISIVIAIIMPVVVISFDTCRRIGDYRSMGQLFILYFTYILARIWAMFK